MKDKNEIHEEIRNTLLELEEQFSKTPLKRLWTNESWLLATNLYRCCLEELGEEMTLRIKIDKDICGRYLWNPWFDSWTRVNKLRKNIVCETDKRNCPIVNLNLGRWSVWFPGFPCNEKQRGVINGFALCSQLRTRLSRSLTLLHYYAHSPYFSPDIS